MLGLFMPQKHYVSYSLLSRPFYFHGLQTQIYVPKRLGGFARFPRSPLPIFLAETRGVHDVFNVVGAGSATAAVFGLIMPGSLAWRARNVFLGSVLGATVCFPLGWLQLKLMKKANEGNIDTSHQGEVTSGVGAAIERLEKQLRK